jgi:deuterolysin
LTTGLSSEDFTSLAVGETKTVTVETAALHSLNEGGDFDVYAEGLIPYAEADSTELSGSYSYSSNKLTMTVDGAIAATVEKALAKRTVIGSSCTGTKLSTIRTALSNCQRLASSAASAASAGTKLSTYYKSTTTSTKNTVNARLTAVARDCGGTGSATTTNCNDPYGGCSSNVLAYTVPSANFITYCPLFFSALPALASSCHQQDQATTVLHEETHAPGVYSPGTDDLAYGYNAAIQLSTSQALNNADTYALYANGKLFTSLQHVASYDGTSTLQKRALHTKALHAKLTQASWSLPVLIVAGNMLYIRYRHLANRMNSHLPQLLDSSSRIMMNGMTTRVSIDFPRSGQ